MNPITGRSMAKRLFLSVKVTRVLLVLAVGSVLFDACVAGTLVGPGTSVLGSGMLVGVEVRAEHASPVMTIPERKASK